MVAVQAVIAVVSGGEDPEAEPTASLAQPTATVMVTERVNVEKPAETVTETVTAKPKPAPTPKPAPAPTETVSQENARGSAADYLDYSAFSRSGLIDQLKFEGFSIEDATYGVASLNADWNEQAAKSAKEYLDYSSFPRSGLVDQLKYEGFTPHRLSMG